ncbi:MAG: type II and III secretion system protein family protein, partial [Burkholderiales bacterium]
VKFRSHSVAKALLTASGIMLMSLFPVHYSAAAKPKPAPQDVAGTDAIIEPAQIGPNMQLTIGKSTLLRMPAPVDRVSIGSPDIADVTLISPRELYLLGKTIGTTNLILWSKTRGATIIDISVNFDISSLRDQFRRLMPNEPGIKVDMSAEFLVLDGTVSSALAVDQALQIAQSYVNKLNRGLVLPVTAGGGQAQGGTTVSIGRTDPKALKDVAGNFVINRLKVTSPQQVMLEVKVAEVNRNLLESLGAQFNLSRTNGDWTYSIISSFLSDSAGLLTAFKAPDKLFQIDAEKEDGLVKILAEPNVIAISGQEAEFLAGGRIFIPVARDSGTGGVTITLEEKEFGVGLRFTPTVLDGGRINLRVAPEVSELSQTGTPFTTIGGVTAVIPSFTTRRAATTVQLNDGQSFAIAGLIRSNVTETVRRFPVLGEVPILGALFRSSEFQADRSELLFIITPRLVKPLPPNYALPTDSYTPPSRPEFFLEGKMEGSSGSQSEIPPVKPAGPGGFEVK